MELDFTGLFAGPEGLARGIKFCTGAAGAGCCADGLADLTRGNRTEEGADGQGGPSINASFTGAGGTELRVGKLIDLAGGGDGTEGGRTGGTNSGAGAAGTDSCASEWAKMVGGTGATEEGASTENVGHWCGTEESGSPLGVEGTVVDEATAA